jgi:mannosylglucosylglycerate synthase
MSDRIAMLHYAGPPYVGGVEITIAAHGRALAADGRRVLVLSGRSGAPESWLPPDLAELVEVRNLPELGSRGLQLEPVAQELAGGVVSTAFHSLVDQLAAQLRDLLRQSKAMIVHNVLTLHKNLALTAALHRLHVAGELPPLLAWCHDFAWRDPLYLDELHPGWPWELLRTAWPGVRYVVVSEDRRAMLAELLSVPTEQIAVAPPGIDFEALLKLEPATATLVRQLDLLVADPLLLLPARITRRKNIELAISVVGELVGLGLRPRLVVSGPPGPHNPTNAAYLAELQALRQATDAPESVIFLYEHYRDGQGQPLPVSDAMVADLYRLADGLLFPSRYEGFGIPILEAGALGLPIFCSAIAPLQASAGDAAHYFALDAAPGAIARMIADTLRADPRSRLRQQIRTTATWAVRYQRDVAPLLDAAVADASRR